MTEYLISRCSLVSARQLEYRSKSKIHVFCYDLAADLEMSEEQEVEPCSVLF